MVLENYLPWIPYELIGKVTVATILLVVSAVIAIAGGLVLYAIWYRGLTKLANKIHEDRNLQDPEERPPVWQVRVAGVALAIRNFDISAARDAYSKADSLTENDDSVYDYLSEVFGEEA